MKVGSKGESSAYRCILAAALLLILGACATQTKEPEPPDYNALMEQAEAAAGAGRKEEALNAFAEAAKVDPTRKNPWVRIAQIRFGELDYAHAIVAAEEVLQRAPDDTLADSILTVSGFRLAHQALWRLQERGALATSTARDEAKTLADALGAILQIDVFSGLGGAEEGESRQGGAATGTQARAPARRTEPPAETETDAGQAGGSDPFQRIGGD